VTSFSRNFATRPINLAGTDCESGERIVPFANLVTVPFRREVRPEKGYAISSVGTFEGFLSGSRRGLPPQLGTQSSEMPRLGSVYIPGEHPRGETSARLAKDGSNQTATLRASCSYDCDTFLPDMGVLLENLSPRKA